MKIIESELKGVYVIDLEPFEDHRGEYVSLHDENKYGSHGINVRFIQDSVIFTKKNVLRGIHGDDKTWKLISCLKGDVYQVIVNCNKDSKDFGKWAKFLLNEKKRQQIVVPPKFGNAFLILSDEAIYNYKQSSSYEVGSMQFSYRWNDPFFGIDWPVKNPILSQRDAEAKFFER